MNYYILLVKHIAIDGDYGVFDSIIYTEEEVRKAKEIESVKWPNMSFIIQLVRLGPRLQGLLDEYSRQNQEKYNDGR